MGLTELYQQARLTLFKELADDIVAHPEWSYLTIAAKYQVSHPTVIQAAKLHGVTRKRGRISRRMKVR